MMMLVAPIYGVLAYVEHMKYLKLPRHQRCPAAKRKDLRKIRAQVRRLLRKNKGKEGRKARREAHRLLRSVMRRPKRKPVREVDLRTVFSWWPELDPVTRQVPNPDAPEETEPLYEDDLPPCDPNPNPDETSDVDEVRT